MPQFSDDLFLGTAQTYMGVNTNAALGDPSPMDTGVGPLGRIYVWDTVPAAIVANNIVKSAIITSSATVAAGTSSTSVIRPDGVRVVQLDVPRAVTITGASSVVSVDFTVSGYDYYGQPMSELITGPTTSTATGKKAFFQISTITVSASTVAAVTVGTSDVLGSPVRIADLAYITHVGYNNTLAGNAATVVKADATTATTGTGDVRGTVLPNGATDGSKRLVVGITLPALAVGPNATRAGALGVTQL